MIELRKPFPFHEAPRVWAWSQEFRHMVQDDFGPQTLEAYIEDWRAQEALLNAFPQFKARVHGIDVHFLHVPGKGPDPKPLLLMHGWPGSVFEFVDLIPRLTDPAAFGGDPADAFTVVAPSLPGFGLSFAPGQKRFSVEEMAECLHDLMTGALGYRRYAAQGGDYGAIISSRMGYAHPAPLIGIHINLLSVRRDRPPPAQPTPAT